MDSAYDGLRRRAEPLLRVYDRLAPVLPRPLDPVRSIKAKLGLVVVASGAAGLCYFWIMVGWFTPGTSAVAISLSLFTTLILAHGTTLPLREMTVAARAMARGDYTQRVRASSRDEVGELARAFNQMAADLAAADRHRRELIANVSHELRTPIAALRGVLENIVDGVAEPDPATLRTALAQTERLGRLVAELLDLSRIDAGAHTLHARPFEVGPFIDEVVAEARMCAERSVRFAALVDHDAPVTGDRDRLKQVLLNLADNAARHSPPGGAVEIVARLDEGDTVVEVRDEGPGIPPEERDLVFARFTRGERATGGGTGLGLAIARWVVHLHGGDIRISDAQPAAAPRSAPGCLITVRLPGNPARVHVPTEVLTGAHHV